MRHDGPWFGSFERLPCRQSKGWGDGVVGAEEDREYDGQGSD